VPAAAGDRSLRRATKDRIAAALLGASLCAFLSSTGLEQRYRAILKFWLLYNGFIHTSIAPRIAKVTAIALASRRAIL
jgi:hypothetical protein